MEIERKFLFITLPDIYEVIKKLIIHQAYLVHDQDNMEVRIRKVYDTNKLSSKCFLELKKGRGLMRREESLEISSDMYSQLLRLCDAPALEKTREVIRADDGRIYECDTYHDILNWAMSDKLKIAEIEFPSEEEAKLFTPPEWLGEEVTGNPDYSNRMLWKGLIYYG